VSPKRL